jgi:cell division transport system permease protein
MKTAFLRYFLRQAMANIGQNRLVHLIGVGTMVIAFLIFDAFVLIFVNLNYWIEERGRSLNMSIYFKEEPDSALLENIKKDVLHFPGVRIKGFISKDEALRDLKGQLGEKAGLLDGLEVNPLPASLEIVLVGDAEGESLAYELKARLERIRNVDEVYYSQEWIKRFQAVVRAVKIIGLVLGGLLFLAALFIITNTIRLTIYSRKDEIEILKLVGATNSFVKTPFLIEGSIQGFLGGAGALMVLFVLHLALLYKADISIGFATLDVIFLSPRFALFLVLLSTMIGFVGSMVSLGRFFRI